MENENRCPGEVVETYRRPEVQEVVERYSRPLPWLEKKKRPADPPARPRRKSRRGLWMFLACLTVTTALAGGLFLLRVSTQRQEAAPFPFDFDRPDSGEESPLTVTIPAFPSGQGARLVVDAAHGSPLSVQEIYQTVNPAVVAVLADMEDSISLGTGVIFTQDGYVLTNYHVVEGGSGCTISLESGRSYEAKYVAGDADSDLAVLKVEASGLPAADFGDSDGLTVGDRVYAIGNPLGMELRGTLTDGIVSAINRDVRVEGRTMTLIQTNAALNFGNSGGPLINEYGQVVGINTIKMTSRYSSIEGLGFAIPTSTMDRLVNDLLTYGEVQPEPTLGIVVVSMGQQTAEGGPWGIQVLEVTPGSAAEAAGVQVGDYILAADGAEVLSSRDLLRARRQHHLGESMELTLWRGGETMTVYLIFTQM